MFRGERRLKDDPDGLDETSIMTNSVTSGPRWLKVELHSHCSLDPIDYRICSHNPEQLISRAATLGYDALAITCHDLDVWNRELSAYAENLGITLIPGMEANVEGMRHTLLYNFRTGCENVNTFEKIQARSGRDTLVVAPHPYYPATYSLRNRLKRNIEMFDAIEVSGFYLSGLDFNDHARQIARVHRKPLVGNGDVHQLWQLGRTFSWIYSEPSIPAILDAVKRGAVRVESSPLSILEVADWWFTAAWRSIYPANSAPSPKIGTILPENP